MIEVERSTSLANQAEKRQKSFDRTIDEWKQRVDELKVWSALKMWCDVIEMCVFVLNLLD